MDRFHRRLFGFLVLVLGFLGLFVYRLAHLQIIKGESYARFSRENSLRQVRVPASRGKVFDRNGKILIENRPSFSLTLEPLKVKNAQRTEHTLSFLLDWPLEEVQKKLSQEGKLSPLASRTLLKDLFPDQVAQIRGKFSRLATGEDPQFDLNGIELSLKFERVYPGGVALGHLLGYVREANEKDLSRWKEKEPGRVGLGDKVGVTGVEKSFDEMLRGYDGFRRIFVDARGKEVDLRQWGLEARLQESAPQTGKNLYLTIDGELSQVAYEALGEQVGAVVALNPQNGEILSLVSKPSYHPQKLSGVLSHSLWSYLRDHPDKILLNRPLQAAYPPGSTHKIVTAVAALAEGKVDPQEKIRCHGFYRYGGRNWGCWNKGGHGSLNLTQALKHSCDVFFYKLGERLGPDKLAHYATLLGLGRKTQVLKDYERSGLIPTAEWKKEKRKSAWTNSDNLGNAIGQGFNLVTPLQSALMMARFANGGRNIKPHLLLASQEGEKPIEPFEIPPAPALDLGLDLSQLKFLRQALVGVVQSPGGTGKRARVEGVTVGGKTGTAQVIGLGKRGKPGVKTGDHAWFLAFAPAQDPSIVLAVVVEHGGSGGAVAAPVAQKVLETYFKNRKQHEKKSTLLKKELCKETTDRRPYGTLYPTLILPLQRGGNCFPSFVRRGLRGGRAYRMVSGL